MEVVADAAPKRRALDSRAPTRPIIAFVAISRRLREDVEVSLRLNIAGAVTARAGSPSGCDADNYTSCAPTRSTMALLSRLKGAAPSANGNRSCRQCRHTLTLKAEGTGLRSLQCSRYTRARQDVSQRGKVALWTKPHVNASTAWRSFRRTRKTTSDKPMPRSRHLP